MKHLLRVTILALLCSCSTYNIIVVADKDFMDEVKADYNTLYLQNLINSISMYDMRQPEYNACPLMKDLPTWPAPKFKAEY